MDNQSLTPNPEEQAEKKTPPFSDPISDASSDDPMMKTSISEPTPPQMANPDIMKTMMDGPSASSAASQPTPPASKPPSAPYDPHATQFIAKDQPPVNVDPYATEFIQIPAEEKAAAIETAKRKTQDHPAVPASEGRKLPSFNVPKMNLSGTSLVSGLGLVPLAVIYAVVMLLSALGLAWFMRFFGILVLYGEISVVRTILGILGAGLAGGLFFALKYLPQVSGLQKHFDEVDKPQTPIDGIHAKLNFWFFLFAGVVVALTLILSVLTTEHYPLIKSDDDKVVESFNEATSESDIAYHEFAPLVGTSGEGDQAVEFVNPIILTGVLMGIIGAALVALSSVNITAPDKVESSINPRAMSNLQIVTTLGFGVALIFVAWSLRLISYQAGDFMYLVLLAFVGLFVLSGLNLQFWPARWLRISSQVRMAVFVAVLTILMMSLITAVLDASSVEGIDFDALNQEIPEDITRSNEPPPASDGTFDYTWRFAYSPAYFAYMLAERGFVRTVGISILLVLAGLIGISLSLQAFNEHLIEDRVHRRNVLIVIALFALSLLLPMILWTILLGLLSFSYVVEGVLLWVFPFALLLGMVWMLHRSPAAVNRVLRGFQMVVARIPSKQLSFIVDPIRKATSVDANQLKELVTWPLGIALAMGLSIIAAPFALSFWFYGLVVVFVLFLISGPQLRQGTSVVEGSPSAPSTSVPPTAAPLPPTPPIGQPTEAFQPPTSPEDEQT